MKALRTTSTSVGVVFLFTVCTTAVLAQAPVEDLSGRGVTPQRSTQSQPQAASQTATVDMYLSIQTLREEISLLRGLIEELGYDVKNIQSRQATDYANLDARILELSKSPLSGAANASASPSASAPSPDAAYVAPETASAAATNLYSEALAKLRAGDRDGALASFGNLIKTYPKESIAADAYYWVGETHWVAGENEKARDAYAGLINNFPNNRKYGDALYKLARVYLNLNNKIEAVALLQKAKLLGGDVGARATELLEEINPPRT